MEIQTFPNQFLVDDDISPGGPFIIWPFIICPGGPICIGPIGNDGGPVMLVLDDDPVNCPCGIAALGARNRAAITTTLKTNELNMIAMET